MTERTDTDAIAELVNTASGESRTPPAWADLDGDPGNIGASLAVFTIPEGTALAMVDTELLAQRPRRPIGVVQVHDAAGFAQAVRQRAVKRIEGQVEDGDAIASPYFATVYADEDRKALVAILNDDATLDEDEFAGWRDHRIELVLRERPEWVHWKKGSGVDMEQERFALHVEEGLDELVDPTAADMLDLAQHFRATVSGRFQQGNRLAGGKRELIWTENADAQAGENGNLTVPEELTLAIRPYYGSEKVEVKARFYFKLREGKLTLGYRLVRPIEVELFAYNAIRIGVESELTTKAIAGVAPAARTSIVGDTPALRITAQHNYRREQ